eukprot:7631145-Alexandrium_andersonii.AAC.1
MLFWATPVVARLAQQLRPDVNVQVVVGNAGSMRGRHRQGITRALGLAEDDERVWLIDTAD